MLRQLFLSAICLLMIVPATGQMRPREDDHFWRRKVVNRIDLNEKINFPLIQRERNYYQALSQFEESNGLIMALFNGLKAGRYTAYDPDSLEDAPMSYQDVLKKIQKLEGSLETSFGDEGGLGGEGDFDAFGGEDFGDFGDDFGEDGGFGEFGGDDFGDFGEEPADDLGGGGGFTGDFDPAPFENVIQFVEDRIFDKNRSDMVYDIQYIEIIWTDIGETQPEERLCVFKYEEVIPILEETQWKNRFNDAEYRTLRDIFDLRLFHSFITEVSGIGARTLDESEQRRQQMVEFEHYLWSY